MTFLPISSNPVLVRAGHFDNSSRIHIWNSNAEKSGNANPWGKSLKILISAL